MDGQPASVVSVGSKNITGQNLKNVGNHTTYNVANQNIRVGADQDLLRALRMLVVPEAMHDSKEVDDQGTCHPGTRIIVLEDVKTWIDHLDPEFTLKWMKGAAGAGKSAIARTVAKLLAEDDLLLASFFCWRSSEARSDGSKVIPTLVNQIIARIPSVRPIVEEAFRGDPYLFTKSMEIQATRLIIEPLASIEATLRPSLPRVIVIDGLDEIKGADAQRDILKTVAFLIDNLPIPIHFFITSRPEHQIQECFTQFMGNRWSVVSLDDSCHPDRDIVIYYKDHFSLIVAAFPSFKLGAGWPGEAVRRVLVAKGSGQFIFASIVIRFVGNTSIALSPQKRLDMILENVSNDKLKPLELLDLVYATVFRAVPEEELEEVHQLVGLVLLPVDFTKSPRVLDAVLCLEPGTTENRLRYLHSVLKVPSSPDEVIAPLHATLGDFIFNHYRSHSFGLHLDREQFHQGVLLKILKGSMVHPASERLNDCCREWFDELYRDPIRTFVKDQTFRTTLAIHVRKVKRSDITTWPPLALTRTYFLVVRLSKNGSSWRDPKDHLFWRSLEKKIRKEELRRFRSYFTDMGITGQRLVLLHLARREDHVFGMSLDTFLEVLPDPDIVASQKRTGLALPGAYLYDHDPDVKNAYSSLAGAFLDPAFLETFFTRQSVLDIDAITRSLSLVFNLARNGTHTHLVRLLSLRNLPQNEPRWGNDGGRAFDQFLGAILQEAAKKKAKTDRGPKFEAAKKELLEAASVLERQSASR